MNKYNLQKEISKKLFSIVISKNAIQKKRKLLKAPRVTTCNFRTAFNRPNMYNYRSKDKKSYVSGEIVKKLNLYDSYEQIIAIKRYKIDDFIGFYPAYLAKCGSIWTCPCCSSKITMIRTQNLKRYMTEQPYKSYCMVTETLPHQRENKLKDNFTALTEIRKKRANKSPDLKKYKSFKGTLRDFQIDRIITNWDIKYSNNAGWHLHNHGIMFSQKEIDINKLDIELKKNWLKEVSEYRKHDKKRFRNSDDSDILRHGIKVSRPKNPEKYILKMGYEKYMMEKYSAAEEIIKGNSKIKGHDNPWTLPANLLFEYYTATKGKKLSTPWPRTFGRVLNSQTNQEILDEGIIGAENHIEFTYDEWIENRKRLPEIINELLNSTLTS